MWSNLFFPDGTTLEDACPYPALLLDWKNHLWPLPPSIILEMLTSAILKREYTRKGKAGAIHPHFLATPWVWSLFPQGSLYFAILEDYVFISWVGNNLKVLCTAVRGNISWAATLGFQEWMSRWLSFEKWVVIWVEMIHLSVLLTAWTLESNCLDWFSPLLLDVWPWVSCPSLSLCLSFLNL